MNINRTKSRACILEGNELRKCSSILSKRLSQDDKMTQIGKLATVDLNQLSQSEKEIFMLLMPLAETCASLGQSPWYV